MNKENIPAELSKLLKEDDRVVSVILAGSFARETFYKADPYSDMEIYIVVKDGEKQSFEKDLPAVVEHFGKVVFSYKNQWAGFSAVYSDLFRLELPVVNQADISNTFNRPKAQPLKVLFDKTGGKFQKVLDNRPEKIDLESLFSNRVQDFWYMLILAVQYYKKNEYWNSRSALQILQSSLIKLFEILDQPEVLLLEHNKRVEQFITAEHIESLRKVSPSYDKEKIRASLINMIDIFPVAARKIRNKYGYQYNETIEEDIKPKLLRLLTK